MIIFEYKEDNRIERYENLSKSPARRLGRFRVTTSTTTDGRRREDARTIISLRPSPLPRGHRPAPFSSPCSIAQGLLTDRAISPLSGIVIGLYGRNKTSATTAPRTDLRPVPSVLRVRMPRSLLTSAAFRYSGDPIAFHSRPSRTRAVQSFP